MDIKNETYDGDIINKAGTTIYDDNTRYLTPILKVTPYRTGSFRLNVKFYANGSLSTGSDSPTGYTYQSNIYLNENLETQTIELTGWGGDSPGHWSKGGYRIEVWWEDAKLFTKTFNIYSGFWHNLGIVV